MLVASTNNEAVNVVAERCDEIAPGLLMRTGNKDALEREVAKLERLLREEAARRVGAETRLLELLRDREERAAGLELALPLLEGVWAADADGPAALGRWADRAGCSPTPARTRRC